MAFLLDNLDAEDELFPVSKPLRKLPETDQVKILDLNLQDALNIKVAAHATNSELSTAKETVKTGTESKGPGVDDSPNAAVDQPAIPNFVGQQ
jgi:hypothetical protein